MGRPPKFKKAEDLWKGFQEYVKYVEDNPWKITNGYTSIKKKKENVEKTNRQGGEVKRCPLLLSEFCVFVGITNWTQFKKDNGSRPNFLRVIRTCEQIIQSHQVKGAIVGEYQQNIVARLNGLTEKTEVTGDVSVRSELDKLSDEELMNIIDDGKK